MECCRTSLESKKPLLFATTISAHGAPRPMRLTELQLPGKELHVFQGDAGTSGHSQKSSSSNQQQLHPECSNQQPGQRWHTASFRVEFLPLSMQLMSFLSCSLFLSLAPFFFFCPPTVQEACTLNQHYVCILPACVCVRVCVWLSAGRRKVRNQKRFISDLLCVLQ